ncbi:hypothetical protein EV363DRAFT_1347023 [Boletus edulis]|nr:hypothetical protein EV363DRAFT_1347023 [Boletus edulis]
MFSRPSSPFLQKEKSARPIVPATSHSSTPILMLPFSFSSRSVVNWFSEKLEFRVRERPSAAPIQDPIEPVLTLRANMRGVDGLSPSVGDSGCHAFNRIGCTSTSLPATTVLPGPLNTSGSNPSSSCTASVEAGEPDGARFFKMWRYAPWMST